MTTNVDARLGDISGVRSGWAWFLALGILTVILGASPLGSNFFFTLASVLFFGHLPEASGILSWSGWSVTTFWFMGLYVGIGRIFHGRSWRMFALTVRKAGKTLA